jgi:hypothetical protein
MERKRHGLLKSGSIFLQAKRHHLIRNYTPWIDKKKIMLVLRLNLYLIVSQKTIHEREDLTICAFIENMVNEWGREIILWIGLVQIMKFCTYMNRSLVFVDQNSI